MGPLTLLPILGIALGIGRVTRTPFATAFFLAIAFAILTLYTGGLVGGLWWTALGLHIGGVLLLGREALRLANERGPVSIPVPFGVLVLLCSWFWMVHGADQYFLYDEYAHWGVFLKEMLALDGYWTADSNSYHPRYPPASPLWQYLFNAFLPPSEGKAYFAHFVLLLAPLLTLWKGVRWSQTLWIVAILALVLVAIANFGLGVSTLYVDQIIGVWFLGVILAAFNDDQLASYRRIALYAAPLAVIALLKDVGVAFAACGAAILGSLVWLRLPASQRRVTALRKSGAAVAVLLAPALLCVLVWSRNRDAAGVAHDVVSMDGVVSGMVDEATNTDAARNAEISHRLSEVFFDQQLSNSQVTWDYNEFTYSIRELFTDSYRLTTFGLLLGFVLWWAFIASAVLTRDTRRQWLLVAAGLATTALAYIASVHLSLRFVFGEYGLELPSYLRYVHVVALPMFLFSFCPLLPGFRDANADRAWHLRGWPISRLAAIYLAGVLAVYAFETPYLRPILQPNPPVPLRTELEPLLEQVRANVGTARVWVYSPYDWPNGFVARLMKFVLAPTPAVVERSERFLDGGDLAIASVWRGFDYVWIPSELTAEEAAKLARISASVPRAGLYRVRPAYGGGVTLVALGESDHAY